jgi:alpha-glucosidase (family GH31 glycosyl hydrolase)
MIWCIWCINNHHFTTKTGSGQTHRGKFETKRRFFLLQWLSLYSDPVAAQPTQTEPPLVLTRGVWAGGQRHGIVLWSSDIHSSFEQLASQVPQGVHASMSGIPWWTTGAVKHTIFELFLCLSRACLCKMIIFI